jgi:hypothetical protein
MKIAHFAIFVVVATTTAVHACTCVSAEPPIPACHHVKAKGVIMFVGKVEHIGSKTILLPPDNAPFAVQEVKFRVLETFDTAQSAELVVTDWRPGNGSCGFPFVEGKTYLVDSSFEQKDKSLHLNSCGMTAETSESRELLRELRSCRSAGLQPPAAVHLIEHASRTRLGSVL